MTNVFRTPKKLATKQDLFRIAVDALESKGWNVQWMPGGKSSVRQIVKGGVRKTVSIRTSQDTWIAFPRDRDDNGWVTLDAVDYVVAASVDDRFNPQFAKVHLIDGKEMRERFNRAYSARKNARHSLPVGRGIWVSLYHEEATDPVNRVGAGAGLTNEPIARVPLNNGRIENSLLARQDAASPPPVPLAAAPPSGAGDLRLSIPEAKRLLALSLGVNEADIRITISS
jgi:hypothetical protein